MSVTSLLYICIITHVHKSCFQCMSGDVTHINWSSRQCRSVIFNTLVRLWRLLWTISIMGWVTVVTVSQNGLWLKIYLFCKRSVLRCTWRCRGMGRRIWSYRQERRSGSCWSTWNGFNIKTLESRKTYSVWPATSLRLVQTCIIRCIKRSRIGQDLTHS